MFPSENSSKLDKSLMDAYLEIHEGVRKGHAAGDTDIAKQASQLASDVKYKAKGKVKPGANKEEIKKVYMTLLGASPAPAPVKVLAKKKLLGEGYDKPDEKMKTDRDGYRVPKKDADEARERILAKAKKKKKEREEREEVDEAVDPGYGTAKDLNNKSQSPTGGLRPPKSMDPRNKPGIDKLTGVKLANSHKLEGVGLVEKQLDPVGQEDKDVDNDGDHDKSDKYLLNRRKAIGKAIKKKMKEGFSDWRQDLSFNEESKK